MKLLLPIFLCFTLSSFGQQTGFLPKKSPFALPIQNLLVPEESKILSDAISKFNLQPRRLFGVVENEPKMPIHVPQSSHKTPIIIPDSTNTFSLLVISHME